MSEGIALTRREIEVVRLICAGRRNREIAARLFISEATEKPPSPHLRKAFPARPDRAGRLRPPQRAGLIPSASRAVSHGSGTSARFDSNDPGLTWRRERPGRFWHKKGFAGPHVLATESMSASPKKVGFQLPFFALAGAIARLRRPSGSVQKDRVASAIVPDHFFFDKDSLSQPLYG